MHFNRPIVPILLAFCACFVDVICITGLFHTFTAFISGTLVVLCVEVFNTGDNALLKVFVLVVFFASSLFWYLAVSRLAETGAFSVRRLFVLEAVLIAAFMTVAGVWEPQLAGPLGTATLIAIAFSTVAMSLQNVIMLTLLNRHVPTTMMTGNSLKLVLGIADYFAHPGAREDSRARIRHQALIISAFAAGGLLASFLVRSIGFWALAVPILVLLFLAAAQPSSPERSLVEPV